jgi:DNA-binding response OmpR family regulator
LSQPQPGGDGKKLLIIDDDDDLRGLLADIARDAGYLVASIGEGRAAMQTVADFQPQCIVMDLSLPDYDGVDVLRDLAEEGCAVPIVLISSHRERFLDEVGRLADARGLSIAGTLRKPFTAEAFLAAL